MLLCSQDSRQDWMHTNENHNKVKFIFPNRPTPVLCFYCRSLTCEPLRSLAMLEKLLSAQPCTNTVANVWDLKMSSWRSLLWIGGIFPHECFNVYNSDPFLMTSSETSQSVINLPGAEWNLLDCPLFISLDCSFRVLIPSVGTQKKNNTEHKLKCKSHANITRR